MIKWDYAYKKHRQAKNLMWIYLHHISYKIFHAMTVQNMRDILVPLLGLWTASMVYKTVPPHDDSLYIHQGKKY